MENVILARCTIEFEGNAEGELPLKKGQIVVVKDQRGKAGAEGIWRGVYKQGDGTFARGWFPSHYVKILDEEEMKKKKIKVVKSSHPPPTPSHAESLPSDSSTPLVPTPPSPMHTPDPPLHSESSLASIPSPRAAPDLFAPATPLPAPKLFSTPLDKVLDAYGHARPAVPHIVADTLAYLEGCAMHVPNLFRGSADKRAIHDLKDAFEAAYKKQLRLRPDELSPLSSDPNVPASLLKLFLYYLPSPVLAPTPDTYTRLVATTAPRELNAIIATLPEPNQAIGEVLFPFLARLAVNHQDNKLTPAVLASVFAPILLPPRDPECRGGSGVCMGDGGVGTRGVDESEGRDSACEGVGGGCDDFTTLIFFFFISSSSSIFT
eukprot:TRINITY_DN6534_c0_g1_i2.p1 TRINITY_DN6534_c0_g1~~TRINITY_DN6534_c0_g1_i2.p1  ORF type:complete len:377 (-),score=114.85 TRINITY_DN6534_c0_g1_i2:218-1348(-)